MSNCPASSKSVRTTREDIRSDDEYYVLLTQQQASCNNSNLSIAGDAPLVTANGRRHGSLPRLSAS